MQRLAACRHVSASSQSLHFILSLRMDSSFITSGPGRKLQANSRTVRNHPELELLQDPVQRHIRRLTYSTTAQVYPGLPGSQATGVPNYSKTCLKQPHKKRDQRRSKLVFRTDYHLMQVKSILECSKKSILQYIQPLLSYHLSFRSLFCLFLCGCLRQVLLKSLDTFTYTIV